MNSSDVKHIALLSEPLSFGGIATVTMALAAGMKELGHTVDIIGLDDSLQLALPDGVYFSCCKDKRPDGGSVRKYLAKAIKFCHDEIRRRENEAGKYDLILVSGDLGLRAAAELDSDQTWFIVHGNPMHIPKTGTSKFIGELRYKIKRYKLKRRFGNWLCNMKLVYVSAGLKQYFDKYFGIKAKEALVIHNPFDFVKLRRLAKVDTPERKSLPNPYVVCSGRFTDVKAFDQAVKAFASSGLDCDLVMIGDGPEENLIRQAAEETGIEDRLKFLPFHQNSYSVVAGAKAFLHSSLSEALSSVIIEALILGVPVVAYDCPGGNREIIAPHQPDALAPLGDIEGLGERLRHYVIQPYEIDEIALNSFESEAVMNKYLSLIK